jgi:hypothetical protein
MDYTNQRPPREEYSTLEVDTTQRLDYLPQVAPDPTPPEVHVPNPYTSYPETNYTEVKPNSPYPFSPGPATSSDAAVLASAGLPPTERKSRICGLQRKFFFVLLVLAAALIVGVAVGVAVGLSRSGRTSSSGASSSGTGGADNSTESGNSTALLANTRLATTNFTDQFGHDNYVIVYQLQNKAIFMSAYNSSESKWSVSPVVDGNGGPYSLDDVKFGTSLSLDTYVYETVSFPSPHQRCRLLGVWH